MKSLSEHILEHFSNAIQSTSTETVQESTENNASTSEVNENKEEESED